MILWTFYPLSYFSGVNVSPNTSSFLNFDGNWNAFAWILCKQTEILHWLVSIITVLSLFVIFVFNQIADMIEKENSFSAPFNQLVYRGCKACGREEMEKGCNGEGRIQGGIGTVPGFGWWPIKAYRPCPGFVASGGRYRRRGQSMDEVAFGRGGKGASMASDEDVQSR